MKSSPPDIEAYADAPSEIHLPASKSIKLENAEGIMTKSTLHQQQIYLWDEGNMPTTTEYTVNNSGNFDPPDFRPNIVYYLAKENIAVKGAVLICAEGAFQFRAAEDGAPVAERLNGLGYQCFVANYRLRPYTMQEGALDLGRAVRYVRSHAEDLGMEEKI